MEITTGIFISREWLDAGGGEQFAIYEEWKLKVEKGIKQIEFSHLTPVVRTNNRGKMKEKRWAAAAVKTFFSFLVQFFFPHIIKILKERENFLFVVVFYEEKLRS